MNDCTKTGCRRIVYVCEDCGRKRNALSSLIAERDFLEAELARYKEALEKIAHSMDWKWHDSIPCQECGGTEIAKKALRGDGNG